MRSSSVCVALMLSPLILAAQSGLDSQTYSPYQPSVPNCPIGMRAQQRSGEQVMTARKGERSATFAQRIRFEVDDLKQNRIIAASVRVHGTTAHQRVVPTSLGRTATNEISLTLNVDLTPEEAKKVAADLVLAGFTSVTSIDLRWLRYADGTIWRPDAQESCRVVPDALMLVSEK